MRVLPDGVSVLALAERHRVALSRENAAEVERAIADGRQRTAAGLEAAGASLGGYVDDTTRAAQASLVASLGFVALTAQQSNALPEWLVLAVTAVAALGVASLARTRWRRVGHLVTAVRELADDLGAERDPLLPHTERVELEARIARFDLKSQARSARRHIGAFGGLSVIVMILAAMWVLARDAPAELSSPLVTAEGYLRVESGEVQLCQRLVGPEPGACAGSVLTLVGVDLGSIRSLTDSKGAQWSEETVRVIGTRSDGTLRVVEVPAAIQSP